MALLGTYGGADDVRILQNRILAEQAGALIPEGRGTFTYPKPVVKEIPTITITPTTGGGIQGYILDVSSPGTMLYDTPIIETRVSWYTSVVGTSTSNNTKIVDIPQGAITQVSTVDFPDLVIPCVIYAKVLQIYTDADGVTSSLATYSDGKQIPALPVADPIADPVVRTASTRTTRKVTEVTA